MVYFCTIWLFWLILQDSRNSLFLFGSKGICFSWLSVSSFSFHFLCLPSVLFYTFVISPTLFVSCFILLLFAALISFSGHTSGAVRTGGWLSLPLSIFLRLDVERRLYLFSAVKNTGTYKHMPWMSKVEEQEYLSLHLSLACSQSAPGYSMWMWVQGINPVV